MPHPSASDGDTTAPAAPSSADPHHSRRPMKLLTHLLPLLLLGGLLVLPGCQSAKDKNHAEVQRIAAEYERYQREWGAEQLRFQRENPTPSRFDYGINGTLILHEAELVGLAGREKLRVKFSFINTTGVTIKSAEVRLMLIDTVSELEWGEVMDLRLPFSFDFTHNSSYTGLFEVPLEGLQRRPGWTWRMDLEAVERDVPAGVDQR